MGASSSGLKSHDSTPSMAYGRLRIDSPHSVSSTASHRRHLRELRADRNYRELERSISLKQHSSWTDLRHAAEQTPLLSGPKTMTDGGAMELSPKESFITVAPPLIVWIGPALLCALAYALYNIFIKKGSSSIHPILGGVILQFVAAILGSLLLGIIVIQQYKDGDTEGLYYDADGVRWAICAGISVGAAEILSFFVSSLGVQAMQSIPTIIGGSVFFGCILGAVLLKEVLTYRGWFGVFLICAGISLVGMDPAAVSVD